MANRFSVAKLHFFYEKSRYYFADLKYYFDLKSETFAKLLLAEKGVFFVPGSCFDKEYYFRLGLAQDSKLFKSGLDELSNFVDEHLIS